MGETSISCKASANYEDISKQLPDIVKITRERDLDDELDNEVWITFDLKSGRDDDYITLNFKLEDLLVALGRVLRDG